MTWIEPTVIHPSATTTTPSRPRPDLTCPYCGKVTQRRQHLENHIRTHTGEKIFQCPICPHKSSEMGNLKKHIRTHTGEKPYQCKLCNERFRDNRSLKIHIIKHHELESHPPLLDT